MTTIAETRLRGECERCHDTDCDPLYELDSDAGAWLYCEKCTQREARLDHIAAGDHPGDLYRPCARCSLAEVLSVGSTA